MAFESLHFVQPQATTQHNSRLFTHYLPPWRPFQGITALPRAEKARQGFASLPEGHPYREKLERLIEHVKGMEP